ncbi:hypothetical protein CRYUN_Cryun13aG0061500 [Craigia yunnanensis]
MHSQLILSTLSVSIFTFFISLFLLPISYSQDDEIFKQCLYPFKCGVIENLIFPFWTDDHPQLCHQQGFRLTKCDDSQPIIIIGGHEFRLLYLNHVDYTMTIARNDLWKQICPPIPINVTLSHPFLSYPQTNRNLTLFYNCTLPPRPVLFQCTEGLDSFYADDLHERANYEEFSDACDTAIQIQVTQSAFVELQNETPQSLDAWKRGFDLKYNLPEIFCQKCNSLEGKCANLSSDDYPICKNPVHSYSRESLRDAMDINFVAFNFPNYFEHVNQSKS